MPACTIICPAALIDSRPRIVTQATFTSASAFSKVYRSSAGPQKGAKPAQVKFFRIPCADETGQSIAGHCVCKCLSQAAGLQDSYAGTASQVPASVADKSPVTAALISARLHNCPTKTLLFINSHCAGSCHCYNWLHFFEATI